MSRFISAEMTRTVRSFVDDNYVKVKAAKTIPNVIVFISDLFNAFHTSNPCHGIHSATFAKIVRAEYATDFRKGGHAR
eukprot:22150-Pleurochrysis_carterae.AAC.1